MSRKNPKLVFIKSIAEQERLLDQKISSEAKSAVKTLQQYPKSHYSIRDLEELVEKLKQKMQSINKSAHTEFSKIGLKGVDKSDLIVSDATSFTNEEFEQLKEENEQLKEKISDISALEMKNDDLQILLDEKETEIAQLKNQSGIDTGKVSTQMEDLNRLQGALDEAQREAKGAIQDREKMETEFETVGNALMAARLEIEQLQQVLGSKDQEIEKENAEKNIIIENLKSEVQVLSSYSAENIKLKETVSSLQKEMDTLRDNNRLQLEEQETSFKINLQSQVEKVSQLTQQIQEIQAETNQIKEQLTKLEQENEDLLLDSGETSQEAIAIRNKLEETEQAFDQKEEENRELLLRVERSEKESQQLSDQLTAVKLENKQVKQDFEMLTLEITTHKQELGEKTTEAEEIQDKLETSQEFLDELQNNNRSLEARVKDLDLDLRGKDERVQIIEYDRNELRETLTNLKIKHEKQETLFLDIKTQLNTKVRELEEKQKDLETLKQRQEEIAQQADASRSKQAEIARERDKYENTLKDLQTQLNDIKNEKDRADTKLVEIKADLDDKIQEVSTLTAIRKQLEEKSENLKTAVDTLRINLAKNPKYAILFVLQDIQQATLTELAKTVAIQNVFATRLLKELETEGWISYNEENGEVILKKSLLELD